MPSGFCFNEKILTSTVSVLNDLLPVGCNVLGHQPLPASEVVKDGNKWLRTEQKPVSLMATLVSVFSKKGKCLFFYFESISIYFGVQSISIYF